MRAAVERKGNALSFTFALIGDMSRIRIPLLAPPARRDELWRRTCFEAFLRPLGGEAYFEFNFSPSGEWAAYAFDGYRHGMRLLETPAPSIGGVADPGELRLLVSLPLKATALDIGLSAVIEDVAGHRSYWALVHPSDKPDFHHPRSFALPFPGPRK
jgi:hypothetical protein